jgi:hypothetical protein
MCRASDTPFDECLAAPACRLGRAHAARSSPLYLRKFSCAGRNQQRGSPLMERLCGRPASLSAERSRLRSAAAELFLVRQGNLFAPASALEDAAWVSSLRCGYVATMASTKMFAGSLARKKREWKFEQGITFPPPDLPPPYDVPS